MHHWIYTTQQPHWTTLTLARSSRANALSYAMLSRLQETLTSIGSKHPILLNSNGRHFCSGLDLKEITQMAQRGISTVRPTLESLAAVLAILATRQGPTACSINGAWLGGGLGLALHTHQIFYQADAQLACPEIKSGLWPFMIGPALETHFKPESVHALQQGALTLTADILQSHLNTGHHQKFIRGEPAAPLCPAEATVFIPPSFTDAIERLLQAIEQALTSGKLNRFL